MPDEPHKAGGQGKRRAVQKKYAKLPVQRQPHPLPKHTLGRRKMDINLMEPGIIICNYKRDENQRILKAFNLTEVPCSQCKAPLMIAPGGRAKVEQEGVHPACIICGVKIMKKAGMLRPEMSAEQAAEIRQAIRESRSKDV